MPRFFRARLAHRDSLNNQGREFVGVPCALKITFHQAQTSQATACQMRSAVLKVACTSRSAFPLA
jgi:hypothetical protein